MLQSSTLAARRCKGSSGDICELEDVVHEDEAFAT